MELLIMRKDCILCEIMVSCVLITGVHCGKGMGSLLLFLASKASARGWKAGVRDEICSRGVGI